jgi:hypothetical protein
MTSTKEPCERSCRSRKDGIVALSRSWRSLELPGGLAQSPVPASTGLTHGWREAERFPRRAAHGAAVLEEVGLESEPASGAWSSMSGTRDSAVRRSMVVLVFFMGLRSRRIAGESLGLACLRSRRLDEGRVRSSLATRRNRSLRRKRFLQRVVPAGQAVEGQHADEARERGEQHAELEGDGDEGLPRAEGLALDDDGVVDARTSTTASGSRRPRPRRPPPATSSGSLVRLMPMASLHAVDGEGRVDIPAGVAGVADLLAAWYRSAGVANSAMTP